MNANPKPKKRNLAEYPARLRPAQVAEYLECSEDLVLQLIKTAALAAVNISATGASRKAYRVSREAVAQFEKERKS
ncbi:MAG TPA: hypothetical protein VGO59_18010 [Verrucomicrobiae bacterium]|jgi:hypothetical protein